MLKKQIINTIIIQFIESATRYNITQTKSLGRSFLTLYKLIINLDLTVDFSCKNRQIISITLPGRIYNWNQELSIFECTIT